MAPLQTTSNPTHTLPVSATANAEAAEATAATVAIETAVNLPSEYHTPSSVTEPSSRSLQTAPIPTPTNKKGGKRSGSPNYSDADVDKLLDIVEELEPIGGNEWAAVAARFNDYTETEMRPRRDSDSLRMKFDKLVNVKKPTGDPSCPPRVRRAKHIARDILGRVNAVSIGDEEEAAPETASVDANDGENGSSSISLGQAASGQKRRADSVSLGARRGKRKPGATGIARDEVDDELIEHVGDISRAIHKLVDISMPATDSGTLTKEEVTAIVKHQMRSELGSVNESLREMKELIKQKL